jgi:hypothetical protein
MKKNTAFLVKLGVVAFLGTALGSCGATPASVATSSSTAASSSVAASSSEAPVVYTKSAGYDSAEAYDQITGIEGGGTGAYSYLGKTYEQRTEILGDLEKYAVDNNIAGLPLYENGGYVMYNPRVTKGTSTYITGYGFSILRDGQLTSEMAAGNEPTAAYRSYYHNWEPEDLGTINALNSDESQTDDLYGNIASSYYGNKMNSTKTGYDWYPVLATDNRPIAIDPATDKAITTADSTTLSTTWRFHVRTGTKGGVAYRSGSAQADRKAFDGTYTTIEDYITPFKLLLNQKNAFYRGSELAGKTGKQGIVGAADYYKATADGNTSDEAKAAWDKVGIKAGSDDAGDYLEFTFLAPNNRFYAMYNLSSGLYEPIPQAFVDLVTPEYYGGYNKDATLGPVDNILSVGPYYLESWEKDKAITFKRNENWYEIKADSNLYRIAGIHTAFITAYATDQTAPFKEFLIGNLDAAGIPQDYVATFKSDPRATTVPGDATFKLNINSCTAESWADLFGTKGTITQTAEADYWKVKPWMSNKDFLKGLFYSINRAEYAANRGVIPSINYFASAYMSDPENGISYDTTTAHANALKDFWGDSVTDYGYSQTAAKQYFSDAINALIASKDITVGTKDSPFKVTVVIEWMYEYQKTKSGDDIIKYVQDAFNSINPGVQIDIQQDAGAKWTDVYDKHLKVGQFDLGFGSISGNTLDPLNFMEVLKSNNSSGFTLNWGPDTSKLDSTLTYDGATWSFDTLWKAADQGVVVYKGVELPPVVLTYGTGKYGDKENSFSFTFSYVKADEFTPVTDAVAAAKGSLSVEIEDFFILDGNQKIEFDASDLEGKEAYIAMTVDEATKTVKVDMTAALVQILGKEGGFYFGAYYKITANGSYSESYVMGTGLLGK